MAGNHRSGRRAIPTALHVLRGTLQSRHVQTRALEPREKPGRPTFPLELENDPQARAAWERLAAQLEKMRVLTANHGDALSLLARTLGYLGRVNAQLEAMNFQELIVEEVKDKTGTTIRRRVVPNPLVRRHERLTIVASRLLGDFGLTPSSQTKVQTTSYAQEKSRASRYITA